jgi:diguanylate cyclase (GGDEF)-like protein/PAS domain S-box-containing protein
VSAWRRQAEGGAGEEPEVGVIPAGPPADLVVRAFEQSGQGMIITDTRSRIVAVNRAFYALTGYQAEELIGSRARALAGQAGVRGWFAQMSDAIGRSNAFEGRLRGRRRNGGSFTAWASVFPVRDAAGALSHFVGILKDIGIASESGMDASNHVGQDPLTGLPNRDALREQLLQAIAGASAAGEQFAVLFLDLDHFKDINDSLGYGAGDQVLKRVAQRLAQCVCADDTLARVGGDEFVILARRICDAQAPVSMARKISQQLYRPLKLDRHELRITSSIGISRYPQDSVDGEVLIEQADTAMYRAKERGPNSYSFFRPDMTTRVQERLLLEQSLHRAVQRNELVLLYQPQIEVVSGRVTGAEALLRWQHPEFGLVTPDRFIPLAEETGLIRPIGAWVLRAACEQMRTWHAAGMRPLRMAVNLSGQQILRSRHTEALCAVIGECWKPVDGWELELEMTESSLQTSENALASANLLKSMGLTLAIDDFGTGYSSMMALKLLPIDRVKIDRSFVAGVPGDDGHAALTTAVIAMGRALGLKVLAEGVESAEQLAFLRAQGCDDAQGYLIGRPMPVEQFVHRVKDAHSEAV